MSAIQRQIDPAPQGEVIETDAATALDAIRRPEVAMAVWRRSLDPALAAWLDAVPTEALPHRRFVSGLSMVEQVVSAALMTLPDAPERQALAADIVDLVERFGRIMSAPRVRVRLEAVDDDACPRFHQDSVQARLLCTYRGPATEWGHAEHGESPAEIHALGQGHAAILKGSRWRGMQEHRLVHRSPPIAGTGVARLLLVVDPADPLEDDDWSALVFAPERC